MNRIIKSSISDLKLSNKPIIIYSLTEEAEAIAYACKEQNIKISGFCDNEIRKTKKKFCDLDVYYTPDLPKIFPTAQFIIGHHTLEDCAEQLADLSYSDFYSPLELLENYDVNKYTHRASQTYIKNKITNAVKINKLYFDDSKTYLRSLDIVITTKCSLNCESCSNLMPYYISQKNTDEKIVEAVEIISKNVDHISEYRLIGGEPLMNKDWPVITNKILDKDPNRIVYIYTNGTICPKDETFDLIKGKNVLFYLTDYDKLSKNINKLIEKLKSYNLGYYRKPAGNWVDCSGIKKHNRTPAQLRQVFKECCATELYTLLNGKLYTCPFIANAANINAITYNKADFVDLFNETNLKDKIRKLVKKNTFFPGCDFCNGRPHDPNKALEYSGKGLIKAGKQIPNRGTIPYKIFNN